MNGDGWQEKGLFGAGLLTYWIDRFGEDAKFQVKLEFRSRGALEVDVEDSFGGITEQSA